MADPSHNILAQAEGTALVASFLPMASSLAAYYSALKAEGFSKPEAFSLVRALHEQLISQIKPTRPGEP